jgi:hypothetical protein
MDAYLIEARSFGGMSGSLFFTHASHISGLRPFAPDLYVPIPTPKPWTDDDGEAVETQLFYFIGIVHGPSRRKGKYRNRACRENSEFYRSRAIKARGLMGNSLFVESAVKRIAPVNGARAFRQLTRKRHSLADSICLR